MNKQVAGKERQRQPHLAVFPPAHRFVLRQEMVHAAAYKLVRDALLVVRTRVNRVPTRLFGGAQLFAAESRSSCCAGGGERCSCSSHPCVRVAQNLRATPHVALHLISIQLRPVTYKAICDLTRLFTVAYIHPYNSLVHSYRSSGPPAGGCRSSRPKTLFSPASAPPKAFFPSYSAPRPFRATHGTCAFTVATTSCASILRGSAGSACCHWLEPSTHTTDIAPARNVPRNMINKCGGNDFLSGIVAGSKTLTLGVSFASCTFASSYCSVSNSKTVS